MKIQIWGCRGSIPRPNPEMARYGGNTPCIEVIASSARNNVHQCHGESVGGGEDGHRIILDLGSGAFDLGHKILGEMFQKKKTLSASTVHTDPDSQQPQPKFGGSILITHTHWDHIQGKCFAGALTTTKVGQISCQKFFFSYFYRPSLLSPALSPSI